MPSIEQPTSLNGLHTDGVPDDIDEAGDATIDASEAVETEAVGEPEGFGESGTFADPEAVGESDTVADPAAVGEADASAETDAVDDTEAIASEPDFLSELAVAMRGVAGQERERLSARTATDAASHIEDARGKGATEAESLRQVADDDVAAIETQTEADIERLRADAADRIEQRRAELESALARHATVVDGEVGAIEGALVEYDGELERFMDELDTVTDPSELARRARLLPSRPDLDRIREDARAAALAEIEAESPSGSVDEGAAATFEERTDPGDTLGQEEAARAEAEAEAEALVDTDAAGDGERFAVDDEPNAIAASADDPATAPDEAPIPIGVMDPSAYDQDGVAPEPQRQAWEEPVADVPVATGSGLGNKTAVRLLRTVAPWTAPSGDGKGSSESD